MEDLKLVLEIKKGKEIVNTFENEKTKNKDLEKTRNKMQFSQFHASVRSGYCRHKIISILGYMM